MNRVMEDVRLLGCSTCGDPVPAGVVCPRCHMLDMVLETKRRSMGKRGHTYGIVPRTDVGLVPFEALDPSVDVPLSSACLILGVLLVTACCTVIGMWEVGRSAISFVLRHGL